MASRGVELLLTPPTPTYAFKGDSCYTGSDNEDDDFNDFTMNKGFIQYSVTFSDT